MIKALLFDYDGVMTQGVPDGTLSIRLAKNLNVPKPVVSSWFADVIPRVLTGKLSDDEALRLVEAAYGKPITPEQGNIWFTWDDLQPLPIMTAFIQKLKARGYTLGLVSNASASTKAQVLQHGGYNGFDFLVISCDAGYKKPGPEIFEIALAKLPGIKPEEVVFLDDREAALATASSLGIQTILVTDQLQAIHDVEAILDASATAR